MNFSRSALLKIAGICLIGAGVKPALEALGAVGLADLAGRIGMSDDLEAAIAEGATIVRVGTAIFGAR